MSTLNEAFIEKFLTSELARLPEGPGTALLDLGCGMKPYMYIYKDRCAKCIAADYEMRSEVDVRVDAKNLPFSSDSFDIVLLTEVIEHISDPARVLAEITRVLKPRGLLLMTWPLNFMIHEVPHDYFRATEFGMAELLSRTSLRIECIVRRGEATAVMLVLFEFLLLGILEAASRAPLVGGLFVPIKLVVSRFMFGFLHRAYVAFTWRRVTRNPVVGTGLKGAFGYLSHWTLGYCARVRKT